MCCLLARLSFTAGLTNFFKHKKRMLFLIGVLAFAGLRLSHGCTSVLVGRDASVNGTAWVGQSNDGEGAGDARLVWVPARTWPAGSMRPVIDYQDYPRYVGKERGVPAYYPSELLPQPTTSLVIGEIPQVLDRCSCCWISHGIAGTV